MKSLSPYCISLIVISAFTISPALAQWEYGGKVIGLRSPSTSALAVAHRGDGNIVVAWDRIRGGDYDIYAQCIDSAGYEMWGEGGMVVYEDDGIRQDFPAVLPDGEGGVFVVWSDWRHTPEDGIALYGQRLDSLGNFLWDFDGVRLTADTVNHEFPQLYDDGHGGFIAVYRSTNSSPNIGAQRGNANGRILWDSSGIVITAAPDAQIFPKTCRATDTTFITCWKDWRDSPDLGSDIYLQSFDLEGNILWDPDGIPAVQWPNNQGYYYDTGHDIVCDGYGGAVVVWVDQRTLYNWVLFADRFSSSGQSLWQANGMQLGSNLLYYSQECQAFRIGSNFMFRWSGDFMVSYVSLSGDFIWDEPVVLDSNHVYSMFMEPEGVFKFLTAYIGEPFSYGAGAKVDTTGFRFWPDYPMIGADIRSESERVLTDGYDGMIMVWKASSSMDIKIAKIYADGHVGGDTLTSVFEDDIQLPAGIILFQNYPNPFNSSTTIRYRLGKKSDAIIEVFDLLGRKILHNDLSDLNAGDHNYKVNMDAFPSGIYFVRLATGAVLSGSIKMVLAK